MFFISGSVYYKWSTSTGKCLTISPYYSVFSSNAPVPLWQIYYSHWISTNKTIYILRPPYKYENRFFHGLILFIWPRTHSLSIFNEPPQSDQFQLVRRTPLVRPKRSSPPSQAARCPLAGPCFLRRVAFSSSHCRAALSPGGATAAILIHCAHVLLRDYEDGSVAIWLAPPWYHTAHHRHHDDVEGTVATTTARGGRSLQREVLMSVAESKATSERGHRLKYLAG